MINVTKTYLPPIDDYVAYLRGIWERGWITNLGPLATELEEKLKKYLGVKHLFFVNNGTMALQIAVKSLEPGGEIVTTPFSYVATTSSIVWEGFTPVFVDIEPESLTIDPGLIAPKISKNTRAILATHVYGIPCDVDAIQKVARAHNLRVIYDAAHAFGVNFNGESVLRRGDISTLSFHATKLFHTGEGGAIVTGDDSLAHKLSYMRNFGHNGPAAFFGLGINGKSSELHAAMGLCVLPKVPELIRKRRDISLLYDELLKEAGIRRPSVRGGATSYNYAYYPVIFKSERDLLKACSALNGQNVFPRRYFYPSLNTLDYVARQKTPVAEDIAPRILCLPLSHELSEADVRTISRVVCESGS